MITTLQRTHLINCIENAQRRLKVEQINAKRGWLIKQLEDEIKEYKMRLNG